MARKTKTKTIAKTPTRRITFNVVVEGDLAEHKIPLLLKEFPEMLDELRSEDKERQILSVWGVVHDGQDPVAEYQYIKDGDGLDRDTTDCRIADAEYLAGLGYKV